MVLINDSEYQRSSLYDVTYANIELTLRRGLQIPSLSLKSVYNRLKNFKAYSYI